MNPTRPPCRRRFQALPTACLGLGLFLFSTPRVSAAAAAMKPFKVEGTYATATYRPGSDVPIQQSDGNFIYAWSNNLWEVQITAQTTVLRMMSPDDQNPTPTQVNSIQNCKVIPGGIRYFTMQNQGDVAPARSPTAVATAEPILYPPPEQNALFACWLSLTPDPALPVTDATHMTRFQSVMLNRNQPVPGTYTRANLPPEQRFLSKLQITSEGAPFSEFIYEAPATTNCNGIAFPFQTVIYRCARGAQGVFTNQVTKLAIQNIAFGVPANFVRPLNMLARDNRLPNPADTQPSVPSQPRPANAPNNPGARGTPGTPGAVAFDLQQPARPASNPLYPISNDTWPAVADVRLPVAVTNARGSAAGARGAVAGSSIMSRRPEFADARPVSRVIPGTAMGLFILSLPAWILLFRKFTPPGPRS